MALPLSNKVNRAFTVPFSDPHHNYTLFPSKSTPISTHIPQTRMQINYSTSPTVARCKLGVPLSGTATESLSSTVDDLGKKELRQTTIKQLPERQLADVWREIHGQEDWIGLLDPMDPILRSELIRYGEMAQACYDAFDFDLFSKHYGSCRFTRRNLFDNLGLSHLGYHVTRYLYVTCNINLPNFFKKSRWPKVWSNKANWIGYIAVSDDETTQRLGRRDITIAWRGTVTRLEWIADLMDFLRPISSDRIPCPDPTVKVESGFLDLYTDRDKSCTFSKYSAREQILTEIKRLLEIYRDEEISITVTGHSLGSALATLSAYDIAETGMHVLKDSRAIPVCVFSFSGPRVGNLRFKERLEGLGVKVLRVVNVHDMVPKSPGIFLNEQTPLSVMKLAEGLPWCYSHVGVELSLDHKNSPFLKPTTDPVCAHNLEAHLHLLDGYHGRGQRFVLASGRDTALVNKASDFLKDHYLVPPFWRQDENKGMVRGVAHTPRAPHTEPRTTWKEVNHGNLTSAGEAVHIPAPTRKSSPHWSQAFPHCGCQASNLGPLLPTDFPFAS